MGGGQLSLIPYYFFNLSLIPYFFPILSLIAYFFSILAHIISEYILDYNVIFIRKVVKEVQR